MVSLAPSPTWQLTGLPPRCAFRQPVTFERWASYKGFHMLMSDVYWALGQRTFDQYAHFVTAVTEYNNQIAPGKHGWQPDRIISSTPITVAYEASWKDEDDLLELTIGDTGCELSMGTFLFVLNNDTFNFFKGADKHFFEGLSVQCETSFSLLVGS